MMAVQMDSRLPIPRRKKECLITAWRAAHVDPQTLGYVEAHGTGTALGDPVEVQALASAFAQFTDRRQFCRIGSLKSNVGHSEPAAGLASLIKVLLAFKYGRLPPTLHIHSPNRHIHFEETPLYLNDRPTKWPRSRPLRRAGVSAFGLSGTNAHLVLEEPPVREPLLNGPEPPLQVLVLSARTPASLRELARRYRAHLRSTRDRLAEICYTAASGRMHLAQRLAIVASDKAEAAQQLAHFLEDRSSPALYHGQVTLPPREVDSDSTPAGSSEPHQLAQRYVAGYPIAGEAVNRGSPRRRVELPTYPFEHKQHPGLRRAAPVEIAQINAPQLTRPVTVESAASRSSPKPNQSDLQGWFSRSTWCPKPLPLHESDFAGSVLLFVDGAGIGDDLARRLEGQGAQVICVYKGYQFHAISGREFRINPIEPEHYRQLIEHVGKECSAPLLIVHLWNCDLVRQQIARPVDLEQSVAEGFDSLVWLSKSLLTESCAKSRLFLVSGDACRVLDADVATAEAALAWGLLRSLRHETSHIVTRAIDLSLRNDRQQIVQALLTELSDGQPADEVAYRAAHRYVPASEPFGKEDGATPIIIRPDGNYVITGGQAGIGLEIARWMGNQGHPRLFLINRTPLPAEVEWGPWLAEHSDNDPIARRIGEIQSLRSSGAWAMPISCDVANASAMSAVFDRLETQFGPIHGIVHAAGALRDGLVVSTSLADMHAVLQPKLFGSRILEQLAHQKHCDFLIFFSSIASRFGQVGQGAYAAANAYLDAMAARHSLSQPRLMSLDWGPWLDTGMAARMFDPAQYSQAGIDPISPALGRRLFAFALEHPPRSLADPSLAGCHSPTKRPSSVSANQRRPNDSPPGSAVGSF